MSDTSGIRIGDAERDEAVSGLAEHFAAGRITKAEYDERADQALQARFRSDLDPLFADLPGAPSEPKAVMRPITVVADAHRPTMSPIMLLFPMLMVGVVVTAVVLHAPWMLFGLVWMFVFTGFGRRQRWHQDRAQQYRDWQQQQQQNAQQQGRQNMQQQQQEWQRFWHDERQRREQHWR